MRLIGSLPTESDANQFGDYLVSIGMNNHVEVAADGRWLVWIEHDDHVEQGQLHLRAYAANPNDPRYINATTTARALRRDAALEATRRQRNYTDVRTSWAALPSRGRPVTIAVCVLCGIVFALQSTTLAPDLNRWLLFYLPVNMRALTLIDHLREMGIINAPAPGFTLRDAFALIAQGQVWRLFTPAFMHANLPHIVFNVWAFLSIGSMIEARRGPGVMIALVFLGAMVSCSAQATWDALTPNGGLGFVGLSGVVYTLFGYAWLRGRVAPQERVGIPPQQAGMMFTWLVVCMTGMIGPIANAAHIVGMLVGIAIGYWPLARRKIGLR